MPSIELRYGVQAQVDRRSCVGAARHRAGVEEHPVSPRSGDIGCDLIPGPSVGFECLPPVVEGFAISPPSLWTPGAPANERNMEQPGTGRLDEAHLGVDEHRNPDDGMTQWTKRLRREQQLGHKHLSEAAWSFVRPEGRT